MYEQLRSLHPELPVVGEARLADLERSYRPQRFGRRVVHPFEYYLVNTVGMSILPLAGYGAWLVGKGWAESIDRLFWLSSAAKFAPVFLASACFIVLAFLFCVAFPVMGRLGGPHADDPKYDLITPSPWETLPSGILAAVCIAGAALLTIGLIGAFGGVSHAVFVGLARGWSMCVLAPVSLFLAFAAVAAPASLLARLFRRVDEDRRANPASIASDLVALLHRLDAMTATEFLEDGVKQELAEAMGAVADRIERMTWLEHAPRAQLETSRKRSTLVATHLRSLISELDFPSPKSQQAIETELMRFISSLATGYLSELPTPPALSGELSSNDGLRRTFGRTRVVVACALYVGAPLAGLSFGLLAVDPATATLLQMPVGFAFTVWLAIGTAYLARRPELLGRGLLRDILRRLTRASP